jgi:tetratricopeptide (TPR) repeat protein
LLRLTLPLGLALPFALWGLAIAVRPENRRRPDAWLLPALTLAYAVSVAAFFVADRYRLPVVPLLLLLAARGLDDLYASIRARRPLRPAAACGVFAFGVFYPFATFRYEADPMPYVRLSDVLCTQGRAGEGLAECRHAAALAPDTPDVLFCFANAYYFQKDYLRAEMALRATLESLQHLPGDVPARRNLVWLYREQQLFADARRECRDADVCAAVDLDARAFVDRVGDLAAYAQAQYRHGRDHQAAGRWADARYAFKRALSADPRQVEACRALAEADAALGLPPEPCVT